ncbi:PREDICTED: uncharacterized protein LOC105568600 [Vollenhovia emeryi]|uniref:uncharacterized protein LOC105568600 n=1 Tax=Vollenhovia emeryi TaxID=411798 RepID=UPI0005F37E42|nr:PREDICTED: uncharacterized protein LOC105568600 [Vollenhovia emeryi]
MYARTNSLFQNMFAATFAFALIMGCIAEIPSSIYTCGREKSFDQCVLSNIESLKDKICNEGIPELNVPSANPLILDNLVIFDTPSTKLYLKDTKVSGLCDFVVNLLHADVDNLNLNIDLTFKQIQINSTLDFNARVLVPIITTAPFYVTSDNVGAKVNADFTLVTKNDKKYGYISKIKTNLDIKGYELEFSNQVELNQMRDIIKNFLGNNQEEVLKTVKPILEEVVSKQVISLSNEILKRIPYEDIFGSA